MLSLLTSLSIGVARFISIAVILLFSLPVLLSAQSTDLYKSGYVITDTNDTIPGYILLDRGNKLNHQVKFKTALTDPKAQSFGPVQAKGFRIVDKAELAGNSKNQQVPVASLFLTAAGTLQPAHFSILNQLVYVVKDIKQDEQQIKVFLQEVISGSVSLYQSYDEHQKEQYFLQKANSDLYPLLEINYLGTLKVLLAECPQLVFDQKDSRKNYSLNLKSLTRIIATYNACAFPMAPVTFNNFSKPSKITWNIGVKGGIGSSIIRYTTPISARIAGSQSRNNAEVYTPQQSFSGGVFTQLQLGKHISLQTELLFMQKGGSVFKELYTGTPARYQDFDEREFFLKYLQLPLVVKYQANLWFKPYLAVGVLMGKEISRNLTVAYYREQESQPRTELPNPQIIEFNKSELGGILGIGCQIPVTAKNDLLLELRYEKTRLPKYSVGILNVNCWQIQTGITIF